MRATRLAEAGRLPDWVLRAGIRALLRRRLERSVPDDVEEQAALTREVLRTMDASPIALPAAGAGMRRTPVPADFFALLAGRHLNWSCCLFEREDTELSAAEAAMLERICVSAELDAGMRILEIGCGWGALSLWMAQHYPSSRITALGSSRAQKAFIDARAKERGLGNIEVVTTDVARFDTDARYDRVVSVESFEQVRNWRALIAGIARWLDSGGKMFLHVACHRSVPYLFEDGGGHDWIARHFLAGAMMPSASLALHFQEALRIERVDFVSGRHYVRTADAWLANLDRRSGEALEVLAQGEDPTPPRLQLRRWRLLLLACSELFGFRGGNEWLVGHYRFLKP